MDYYSEKHAGLCIDDRSLENGVNQITDIIVKNKSTHKKIYEIKNRFYTLNGQKKLDEFIEECTINCDYYLKSHKRGQIFLKQNNSLSYIIITSKETNQLNQQTWTVEIVEPELIRISRV